VDAAQKYQKWMTSHEPPKCFCGNPSRLKKVKKKKTQSRAAGKYFFFCATKKGENPCRFARLVDEVMKEQNRKEKRSSEINEGGHKDSTSKNDHETPTALSSDRDASSPSDDRAESMPRSKDAINEIIDGSSSDSSSASDDEDEDSDS
jgi:hypothetical protein